ncbi:MAG: sigma-E factor regulatory protein RseB domain-containing protein [Candidatus Sulfotelmatobacter sp.]
MKLSLRPATLFFPPFFSRVTGLHRIMALLLLSGFLFLPLMAEAGLPQAAISIPTDRNLAAGLKAAEQCEFPGKQIVLPPLSFDLTGSEKPSSLFEEQAQGVRSMPEGSEIWLHVVVRANSLTGDESEKQITERVNTFLKPMLLSAPAVRGLIVEIESSQPLTAPDRFAFALARLALTAKASSAGLRLAFVFQPGFIGQHGDLVRRLATYSDLLGTTYSPGWRRDAAWIAEQALNKPLILKSESRTSPFLTAMLAASGTSVEIVWAEPADAKAADAVCTANSLMAHSITANMFPADASSSPFSVEVDGVLNNEHQWSGGGKSDVVIVAHVNGSPDSPKMVRLLGGRAGPFEIKWYDPATGAQLPAGEATKTDKGFVQTCACTSEYAVISIRQQSEADQTLYNTVEVKGGVELKVEEIIARWQQNREAQKQKLENYTATSFMSLHFENTNLGPGFDVSMQLKQFFSRDGQMEIAQKDFYVNGVKLGKNREFPLPQIEPEKVLTQPLELKLNERYEYRLLGTEQVNGASCYVVGVEPKVRDEALYSGKIWIDATTFREVKQYLDQRGAKSNVLVNSETQNFELVRDGKGNQFNLLRSISAQQLLNAAGRDFVLQRTVQFSDYVINTPEFSGTLAAERSSDDPMFRDTDEGLRVLQKKGGERVLVESEGKRVRALIAGAMYGGTFNFPVPFLGISIADFDFRHTGAQLSTFFAGPILVSDLSKQYRPKFRLALDLSLNGLPGENRIYSNNIELTQGEVWTWEQAAGLRASWQATAHLSVTASTYLAYDNFLRTSNAAEQYELPRNGLNELPGLEIKYNLKGYVFDAQGTRGERIDWRPFGCTSLALPPAGCGSSSSNPPPQNAALVQRPQNAFTLYNADLNKDYYIGKFTKGGWDISYWGGDQLDRFSRYFPSFLSAPRLNGIPPGTDSFDAIAMANVHYGFNVMDLMKIDGMYAYARARNEQESLQFRKFDGLEVNLNTPGPLGTLVQGTISYALDGNIARYNSRWAAYILIFKPLH